MKVDVELEVSGRWIAEIPGALVGGAGNGDAAPALDVVFNPAA